MPQRVNII